MIIPIAEWTPDLPTFQGGANEALNVFAGSKSYRPFPSLGIFSTTPLTARAQGAFYARDNTSAHLPVQTAGDATKLYLLVGPMWTDATRLAGGAYAAGTDYKWDFSRFGDLIIATNGLDIPQRLSIGNSPAANYSNLGGTPPTGMKFVEVMGDFVVMAHLQTNGALVRWGAINDAENWPASATTQADSQVLPDGGLITGLAGYEYGGLVLQDNAIRRMDYEGSPLIFRFKKLADGIGATIEGSVRGFGDRCFFVHRSGFYMVAGAAEIVPIGAEKVNRFFWADVDISFLERITSAIDPVNEIYALSYVGKGSGSSSPNRLLIYHWGTGRWTRVQPGDHEMIYSGTSQVSIDTDHLTPFGDLDHLPFPLDSVAWSGRPAPLLAGFNTSHNLGYFNGSNLAATVDTTEAQLVDGQRALLRSLRPMVDGGLPSIAIGTRNRQVDAISFAVPVPINSLGACRGRWRGRYHVARLTMPAGSAFNHIYGVDEVLAIPAGPR